MPAYSRLLVSGIVSLAVLCGWQCEAAGAQQLSSQATRQVQALMQEKALRTPAQMKIGSQLLYAARQQRGAPIAPGVASLQLNVVTDKSERTLVDISATVTPHLLDTILAVGGTVLSRFPQYNAIRAWLPLAALEGVADLPEVTVVRPADQSFNNKLTVSEGDVAHRANLARSTFGVTGSGVKIGVLSDSVDNLATVQASDDVGAVTVLSGQNGVNTCGGPCAGEGTAMLEIVSDLAPGAALFFATAEGGVANFANNIQALRTAGCDIIVDDVGYFAEPVFQDGIVAQAVNTVTAGGALYFSAAGNSGNKNDGTSGVWEGDFVDSGVTFSGKVHSFGGGFVSNAITSDSPTVFTLQWSDASGASANDYDLYLLDPTLTFLLAASTDTQNGTQNPFELIASLGFNDTNNRLVIVKFAGAARYLHLNANGGQLSINTAGQTSGHAAAADASSVAAVKAQGLMSPFVGGASNPVETYSSDGPRRVFFLANGTAITPGNLSSTGGTVRQKPDIAAADCVMTSTPGFFNPFCGTSAAAPHAAAIAALLKSANPGLTTAQLRTALTSTTLDIEAVGVDRDSGSGLLDAFAAVQSVALPTVTSTPTNTSSVPTPTPTRTPTLTPTGTISPTSTFTNTPTSTPTVSVVNSAQLLGSVILQGRPAPPNARWSVPLRVSLAPQGGGTALLCTPTTDQSGNFTCGPFPSGPYRACVKHSHTLQNCQSVTLVSGNNAVNFGTLREGDANDDNCVALVDFSILVGSFSKCTADVGFDTRPDFDGSGCVTLVDFSLLATNFSQCGDT